MGWRSALRRLDLAAAAPYHETNASRFVFMRWRRPRIKEKHMANKIQRVSYYIGVVPNKVGEGARVLGAVKGAGVNLVGFLGYPRSARKTEIVLIVDDKAPNLGPIAKKAGVEVGKKQKGLLVTGADRPGLGAQMTAKLAAKGINVVSLHALCGGGAFGALVVVGSADFRKAARVLA
jgi:hypothetical protein